jgi:hypothetical protein
VELPSLWPMDLWSGCTQAVGTSVALIKSKKDSRYHTDRIVTHDGESKASRTWQLAASQWQDLRRIVGLPQAKEQAPDCDLFPVFGCRNASALGCSRSWRVCWGGGLMNIRYCCMECCVVPPDMGWVGRCGG